MVVSALRFAADKNEIQTMNNSLHYTLDLRAGCQWLSSLPQSMIHPFFTTKKVHDDRRYHAVTSRIYECATL